MWRVVTRLLPDLSNFGCLPGRAGGSPNGLGHATYVFSKPSNMEAFLTVYAKSLKGDIRKNRGNLAEKLGYLGRTVHNSDPHLWLKSMESFIADGGRCESGK